MHLRRLQLLLQRCVTRASLEKVHARAVTFGFLYENQPLACKLLNSYAKLGSPKEAHDIFANIEDPDIVSWTCHINLFLQDQCPEAALLAFSRLLGSGLRPDSHAVVGGLSACSRSKNLHVGRGIHGVVLRSGFMSEPIVGNALIDMYSRTGEIGAAKAVFGEMWSTDVSSWTSLINGFVMCGDIESALQMFEKMPSRNEVSWTAMISGCIKGERAIRALELFKEMIDCGVACPTAVTLVAVLSGCADIGALDLGLCIHGYARKVGITECVTVNNALLDMYSKSGNLESTLSLFNEMQSRDVFSWTTIISAYASHGKGNVALEMFYAILDSRIHPNEVTFISVLSACSHAGLVLEGWEIFRRMAKVYGLEPKVEHYGCMVDLLGRAGLLGEAQEFIEQMPMNPDAVIWRSLLSACIFHKNFDLAEVAGKKLMELEPEDDGVYVLLWNLHCATKNWEGALRMRKTMKDRTIKKRPGCSWVEINGAVHEFLAEGVTKSISREASSAIKEIFKTLDLHMEETNSMTCDR